MIILSFLIGFILILGMVLLLPFRILADGVADDRNGLGYNLIINWAFGFFAVKVSNFEPPRLYLLGIPVWRVHFKSAKEKKPTKKSKRKKKLPMAWISWGKNHIKRLCAIFIRFIRVIFLQGHLVGYIGLSDPADTACLELIWNSVKQPAKRMNLNLVCVYEQEIIHINVRLQATLIIGYFILVALSLLLNKENRTMLRSLSQT